MDQRFDEVHGDYPPLPLFTRAAIEAAIDPDLPPEVLRIDGEIVFYSPEQATITNLKQADPHTDREPADHTCTYVLVDDDEFGPMTVCVFPGCGNTGGSTRPAPDDRAGIVGSERPNPEH